MKLHVVDKLVVLSQRFGVASPVSARGCGLVREAQKEGASCFLVGGGERVRGVVHADENCFAERFIVAWPSRAHNAAVVR